MLSGLLLFVWLVALLQFGVCAGVLHRKHRRLLSPSDFDPASARVLLVRPCAGDEAGLEGRLTNLGDAMPWCHVWLMSSHPDDRARPAMNAAAAALRLLGWRCDVVCSPPRGPNHKASLLLHAFEHAVGTYDVVVNVDSGVALQAGDLAMLIAPLYQHQGVAASWAAAVERDAVSTLGARANQAVLSGSFHAFALLRWLDPMGLVGKAFAVRTNALKRLDSLPRLAHALGEDAMLATLLRQAGFGIMPACGVVNAVASTHTFSAVVTRLHRWMLVVKGQRTKLLFSYPLFFFGTTLVLACSLPLALHGYGAELAPGIILVGLGRYALYHLAMKESDLSPPGSIVAQLVDIALAEAALTLAFLRCLVRNHTSWRGRGLRVRAGVLVEGV